MFPCIWRARGLIMPSKQFLCPSAAKACISRDKAPRREVRLETALNGSFDDKFTKAYAVSV